MNDSSEIATTHVLRALAYPIATWCTPLRRAMPCIYDCFNGCQRRPCFSHHDLSPFVVFESPREATNAVDNMYEADCLIGIESNAYAL